MKFAVGTETAVEVSAGYYNGESLSRIYLNGNYVEFGKKFTTYYGKFLTLTETDYIWTNEEAFISQITPEAIKGEVEQGESHMEVVKDIYRTITFPEQVYNGNKDYYSHFFYAFPAAALKNGTFAVKDVNAGGAESNAYILVDLEIDNVAYKVAISKNDAFNGATLEFVNK